MSIEDAARYATAAGAAAVEVFGASPIGAHDVYRKMLFYGGAANKRVSFAEAKRLRQSINSAGLKFGIANGVFDLLHAGHMDMLSKAREECDFLLVLINSDEAATAIKRKPINPQTLRVTMLANLPYVDAVMVFDGETPEPEICGLTPDVLVKGPGYDVKTVPGASHVVKHGGRFVSTTADIDTSTTKTIAEVASRVEVGA
jgi:D-beta-D-heptose 7-phosphate kinase/D-beta-D-heptose 1-phosphate adenosyltransferase